MNADLLERATRAARQLSEPNAAGSDEMLRRIERARRGARPRRRWWPAWAWGLSGSFVGIAAWASASGGFQFFVHEPEPPAQPSSAPNAAPSARHRREPAAPLAISDAERRGHEAVPEPAREPVRPAREAPPPHLMPAAPKPAPATEDPTALYRTAHELHFAKGDYGAALRAWDRYLAVARAGAPMLLEARFNRGVALAHLGQSDLARDALEPFAAGDYGGYRREEARRLLQQLERR